MEKLVEERIIRSAFVAMELDGKVNIKNFEKALKGFIEYECEEFISYCLIAMNILEKSGKIEAQSVIMELVAIRGTDTVKGTLTRNQAIEKAKKLLNK